MKPKSIHGTTRKALRKNRKGGIEGLPLQLMIIIMVATLGTAIIIGWMGNIEEPDSISRVDVALPVLSQCFSRCSMNAFRLHE